MPGQHLQKFAISLTPDEVKELEAIVAKPTSQQRHHERAQILLLRASGATYSQIRTALNVSGPTITKVIKKYHSFGLKAALEDLSRSGRPNTITLEAKSWIISIVCKLPETLEGAPPTQQWTISSLTNYVRKFCKSSGYPELENIQRSTIWSILNDHEIKPHRVKYYLDCKDPEFEEKRKKVMLIYKRVEWIMQFTKDEVGEGYRADELCGEVFLSYDEKPGIQAVQNIAPDLPPTNMHKCMARDYEYKRHGTISVLAGIDLLTGEIISIVRDSHTSDDFIDFLKKVDDHYNKNLTINIILDNHSIHRSKKTTDYLASLPQSRFNFIFTPKHASWLNLIESFFSKMTRQLLRNLRVKSKQDLIDRLLVWFEMVNNERVIFRWKWRLEDIENVILPSPNEGQVNAPKAANI